MRRVIRTKTAPTPLGPYVQAIDTGNIIFVSGQIGICPDTNIISDSIYCQTYQSLQNIKNIIEITGLQINNIIKITLFIVNINDLSEINTSYKKFFNTHTNSSCENTIFPTRSCIEVSKLPKNAKIEIEATAMRFL
ncbi:Rid family detoxifying hydrolase [Blochmannia endosymbiont of Camponotus nipponensis]|uniref:Rid family detoxifying hydrolase n=1 Tax=Blochmannia endosymbiont of Camponotus nipponensis TaxID=2681986 RepID=UPI00135A2510|nr:Rid family detoxifying hydrolase [Blochmannia endosymbiont of Camponotus nipponensis]